MTYLIKAEEVEHQEQTTLLRVENGFEQPLIRFANERLQGPERLKAELAAMEKDSEGLTLSQRRRVFAVLGWPL